MSAKLALRQIGNQRAGGLEHIRLTQLVETKINKKVIFCCFSYCFKDIVINPVLDIDILKAHKITFFLKKSIGGSFAKFCHDVFWGWKRSTEWKKLYMRRFA